MFVTLRVCLVAMLALATVGSAAVLEVGPGQAYTAIQTAVNASADGDEIVIHAGTYNETVSFTDKENLYVHASAGDKVVINGTLSLYNSSSATWTQNNTFERLWVDVTGETSGWAVSGQYDRSNTFDHCVFFGDGSGAGGFYDYLAYGLDNVYNSTFYGLSTPYSEGYASGLHVFDSIIAFNSDQPANGGYAGVATYSDYYDNSSLPANVGDTTGTIHLDPLFASTDPSDPHFLWLSENSPCNDADEQGDNMGALPTVPEPATMVLLGLGALAAMKRKH